MIWTWCPQCMVTVYHERTENGLVCEKGHRHSIQNVGDSENTRRIRDGAILSSGQGGNKVGSFLTQGSGV